MQSRCGIEQLERSKTSYNCVVLQHVVGQKRSLSVYLPSALTLCHPLGKAVFLHAGHTLLGLRAGFGKPQTDSVML